MNNTFPPTTFLFPVLFLVGTMVLAALVASVYILIREWRDRHWMKRIRL